MVLSGFDSSTRGDAEKLASLPTEEALNLHGDPDG